MGLLGLFENSIFEKKTKATTFTTHSNHQKSQIDPININLFQHTRQKLTRRNKPTSQTPILREKYDKFQQRKFKEKKAKKDKILPKINSKIN